MLCALNDTTMVMMALEGLEKILQVGEHEAAAAAAAAAASGSGSGNGGAAAAGKTATRARRCAAP